MNLSVNSTPSSPHSEVLFASSFVALLLVPPLNTYVLVLIVRGGVETITSDFYRLNQAISEMIMCFHYLFYIVYVLQGAPVLLLLSKFMQSFLHISHPLFQGCICVECYLAVVHPVVFLRYKLLRNKALCCSVVWSFTLASCGKYTFCVECDSLNALLGFYTILFSVMLFCCVSVLWVLKRPGPGEGRTQRAEGYDAKRRAFNIIVITTVITVINYLLYAMLLTMYHYVSVELHLQIANVAMSGILGVVLFHPLFYLRRAGKLSLSNFLITMKCWYISNT